MQKTGFKYIIGIDPDTEKSGVCAYAVGTGKVELYNMAFFELYSYLAAFQEVILVVVECGYMNAKSNWHGGTGAAGQRIAKNVGANHNTARLICEMAAFLGLEYLQVKPVTSKVDGKDFAALTGFKRSNAEQRDAYKMAMYGKLHAAVI